MIEVENLVKKYGSHTAVDHLSFHVDEGQIYGFLGPNGAGKSTTMNMMTGYLAATEGKIRINGFDILEQPEEAKTCVGYLPEVPPLYPEMTVKEYLRFAAQLKKVPRSGRQGQIDELMERTGITEVSDRLIKNLSKGYRQRVGLAQALLGDPKVVILDEPTVGLDPKQIIEMRELIRSLREKHTVILSSHILSEVSAVCDHILIISKGRLAASDSPEGLGRLMNKAGQLEITLLGSRGEAEKALAGVPHIHSLSIGEGKEEGSVRLSVEMEEGTDNHREVAMALAERRLPVLEMSRSERSLEDIFLELTSAEAADGDTSADKTAVRRKMGRKTTASAHRDIEEQMQEKREEEKEDDGNH